MASRRRLANFADTYLRYYLQRKNQEEMSRLQGERQRENAQQQLELGILESLKSNTPAAQSLAARLKARGLGRVGQIPIDAFIPTEQENLGAVSEGLEGAKSLSELKTGVGLERDYFARPGATQGDPRPIEELVRQRAAREAQLREALPRREVSGVYNPEKRITETRILRGDWEGSLPTSAPPKEAGENVGLQELGRLGTPGLQDAQISNANAMERGTRGERVRTAGAVSRAEASARNAAELAQLTDPKWVAGQINLYKEKAVAEAAATGNAAAAKMAMESAANSTIALTILESLRSKYDKVKLPNTWKGQWDSTGRKLGHMTGTLSAFNAQADVLDREADGFTMQLYRAFGGTAAQTSDRDLKKMEAMIPYSWVVAEVGDEVFLSAKQMLMIAPMVKRHYGTQPFEKQWEVGQEWVKRMKQAREFGATQFEDPFQPGVFIPVAK